jgi:integrase
MKNGSALVVTLIPDALTLLRTREADKRANEVLVFPSRHVTPAQVEQARQMKAEGKSTHVIAKELGVSQHSAWQMVKPEFVAEDVKPFNGAGFAWRRIVKRAGIKSRLTIHDCRRTFCTAQIEAGTPLPIVAGMMGHRSQATTMKHYAIARPEAIAAAAIQGTAKMFAEAAAAEATQKAKAG